MSPTVAARRPYRAFWAEQTQVGFVDISVAEPDPWRQAARAGNQWHEARAALLPDVPTLSEAGAPGFESLTTFGLFVPAGTPPEVVKKLNGVLNDGCAIRRHGASWPRRASN